MSTEYMTPEPVEHTLAMNIAPSGVTSETCRPKPAPRPVEAYRLDVWLPSWKYCPSHTEQSKDIREIREYLMHRELNLSADKGFIPRQEQQCSRPTKALFRIVVGQSNEAQQLL